MFVYKISVVVPIVWHSGLVKADNLIEKVQFLYGLCQTRASPSPRHGFDYVRIFRGTIFEQGKLLVINKLTRFALCFLCIEVIFLSTVGECTSSQRRGKGHTMSTPKKISQDKENGHHRTNRRAKDDCFSAPAHSMLDDFDFEKNLALFDKQAVFEEIETQGYPKIVRPSSTTQPAKYKCDENVLQSTPVIYKQIEVPFGSTGHYVTGEQRRWSAQELCLRI